MNHDNKYFNLCGGYALGALEDLCKKEFEAHVESGCKLCESELIKMREVSETLYKSLPQCVVQPELKERILFSARLAKVVKSSIQKSEEEPIVLPTVKAPPQKNKSRWFVIILIAAIATMLLGFSIYIRTLILKLNEQREIQNVRQSLITKYADKLEHQNAIIQLLKSYPLEIINMEGSSSYSNCSGKIIWNPVNNIGMIQTSNFPKLSDGKVYQLWMIKNMKPIDICTFSVPDDSIDDNIILIQSKELGEKNQIEEFVVTKEIKKGESIPSSELVLSVKINRQ